MIRFEDLPYFLLREACLDFKHDSKYLDISLQVYWLMVFTLEECIIRDSSSLKQLEDGQLPDMESMKSGIIMSVGPKSFVNKIKECSDIQKGNAITFFGIFKNSLPERHLPDYPLAKIILSITHRQIGSGLLFEYENTKMEKHDA